MLKLSISHCSTLRINDSYDTLPLERKIERMIYSNEPIPSTDQLIYTERKDGIMPAYDIRTDRFELALDATSQIEKSYISRREEKGKSANVSTAESTDGQVI